LQKAAVNAVATHLALRQQSQWCDELATYVKWYVADLGHSLGGALATLAAFDIKQALLKANRGEVKLLCYSFGAPRTGSHAFARDYNKVVPDTWSIINNQVCSAL